MSEKTTFESAEKRYLLDPETIQKMSLEIMTVENPLTRLRITKEAIASLEPNTQKQLDLFGTFFSKILAIMQNTQLDIAVSTPTLFAEILDTGISDEVLTTHLISVYRDVGYQRDEVREWIIASFTNADAGKNTSGSWYLRGEQSKQLQILEHVYGST
jgi:hypothetical protein